MTIRQIAGALILASLFCGLFYTMARIGGWREAAKILIGSLAMTAAVVFAAYLLSGAP